ncbi:adenylyltransferase/cytidyltransferase family protein [Stutzerimonas xanthomarina]|uniref:adenylyltransferase/cytidyltransferase family protein n=1 Tax=Stutzerimonas xanthomarina TaxID=271420 RepID=UPI003AA7DB2C
MKNVLVVGVFDLFHRGHLELLRRAKAHGEKLFVVINGDELTAEYKRRPIYNETDRKEIVGAISFVEDVTVSNSFDIKPYIDEFSIDIIVHGDDWPHEAYLEQIRCSPEYIRNKGINVSYVTYYDGISTSSIISKLKESS